MAAQGAELLLPAHGLPLAGADRIRTVLEDVASVLESLVRQTLDLMNEGARLDQILRTVGLPKELLEKPYLRPVYDEPEFAREALSAPGLRRARVRGAERMASVRRLVRRQPRPPEAGARA
jgi:alkyl sulfatase BDS1-like metallo-beta-lactamase superfamily hydrolase